MICINFATPSGMHDSAAAKTEALNGLARIKRSSVFGRWRTRRALNEIAPSHCLPQGIRSAPTIAYRDAITAGIYDRRNGVRRSFCVATILRTVCPLWLISGHRNTFEPCPLYPQTRTLIDRIESQLRASRILVCANAEPRERFHHLIESTQMRCCEILSGKFSMEAAVTPLGSRIIMKFQ